MNKRDQKDIGKLLNSHLGSSPFGRSSRPRKQLGSGTVWDSDEEHSYDPKAKQLGNRHQHFGGRDQSFKKLIEECNELNTNMQRAKIILGLDQKNGGRGDDLERNEQHRQTNNYRLYGLHYGKMA